jgi:hypothetical protein
MDEQLTGQEQRELLELLLDPNASETDRRNAATMLRRYLDDALEVAEGLDPADGAEPDRAASYERARRGRLTDRDREELEQQRAAIKAEEAKLRELQAALEGAQEGEGRCQPCRSGRHDRCLHAFIGEGADFCCCADLDALEGAQEGGEAIETP